MAENAVLGCKELVQVGGKTLLEHTIEELENAGIKQIVVVSSPSKPAIDNAIMNRGVKIVHQAEPKGLVDAVKCAREIMGSGPCLIALPDVLFPDANPSAELIASFDGETLLAVIQVEAPWGLQLKDTGRVTELHENKILAISDKFPNREFPLGQYRITGRAIWTEAFWEIEDDDEVSTLRCLGSLQKLSACFVKTKYIDVGNSKGYKYAQSIFNQ
tara:strand:+ start:1245 stop:1892 length:648 start_codon:yes stop_codon:yes gene_type:complete